MDLYETPAKGFVMILLWIFSLIVTNVVAVVLTIHIKNNHHTTVLKQKSHSVEYATWSLAFDAGWHAAIDSPGVVRDAYRKMFQEPYQN